MRSYTVHTLVALVLLCPLLVAAQTGPQPGMGAVGTSIKAILDFINVYLVPLIFAVAFIVFLYGIFRYFIYGGANESDRETGKQLAIWAILGFVIMISVWGLVNFVSSGLGFSGSTAPKLPTIPDASSAADGGVKK